MITERIREGKFIISLCLKYKSSLTLQHSLIWIIYLLVCTPKLVALNMRSLRITGIELGPCSLVRMNGQRLKLELYIYKSLIAGLCPCRGTFIALLLLVRSNSMMVALFTNWSLNTGLSFRLY